MDALFFLKHSKHGDLEMRYALRGIERHAPYLQRFLVERFPTPSRFEQ